MRSVAVSLLLAGVLAGLSQSQTPVCSGAWNPGLFPLGGTEKAVFAEKAFDDGSGPALFVGGEFSLAGSAAAARIARWNGTSFSPVGGGMSGGTTVSSVTPSVRSLAVFDDGTGAKLYAAGNFTTAGGTACSNIAVWTGSTWQPLGGGTDGPILAMAVYNDPVQGPGLYVGGKFATAGGVLCNNIARWNGTAWSALSTGITFPGFQSLSIVRSLVVHTHLGQTDLYVGGQFSQAGAAVAISLARWNGSAFSMVGGIGVFATVTTMASYDDGSGPALFAGGSPISPGIAQVSGLARYNGGWAALAPLPSNAAGVPYQVPYSLRVLNLGVGPKLYCGGASVLCAWDGATASWSALGGGLRYAGGNTQVAALEAFDAGQGPMLYAGGSISGIQGPVSDTAFNIVRWNSTEFELFGTPGLDAQVSALTVFDDGTGPAVHAGGHFIDIGNQAFNHVAKWTGLGWQTLGSGVTSLNTAFGSAPRVRALCRFDDGSGPALYAAGEFDTADGLPANDIAKWNGTNWTALGSGITGTVYSLAVHDDGSGPALYVGGQFTLAGGVAANSIAKWTGSAWSAVGQGFNGTSQSAAATPICYALASVDLGAGAQLFAGGDFISSGLVVLNNVARWNGAAWVGLGTGTQTSFGSPSAIRTLLGADLGSGTQLVAGGNFPQIGGASCNGLARWNGASWTALSTGIQSGPAQINALAMHDNGTGPELYATGSFAIAGLNSVNVGRYDGAVWTSMSSGLSGGSGGGFALCSLVGPNGPGLYAGGAFLWANGTPSAYMARWSPPTPSIVSQPQPVTASVGSTVTFSVTAVGSGLLNYQWRRNSANLVGETSPTLVIQSAQQTDAGTFDCIVTDACGLALSDPAPLLVTAMSVTMDQSIGTGSFVVRNLGGAPGASYFSAFSADPRNATQPGAGSWAGLWIFFSDLESLFLTQAQPFVGQLDANGSSYFSLSPGSVPPAAQGITVWCNTHTYDPSLYVILDHTTIASITF